MAVKVVSPSPRSRTHSYLITHYSIGKKKRWWRKVWSKHPDTDFIAFWQRCAREGEQHHQFPTLSFWTAKYGVEAFVSQTFCTSPGKQGTSTSPDSPILLPYMLKLPFFLKTYNERSPQRTHFEATFREKSSSDTSIVCSPFFVLLDGCSTTYAVCEKNTSLGLPKQKILASTYAYTIYIFIF